MKIKNEGDLKKIREKGKNALLPSVVRIQVGAATCGLAKRAKALKEALEAEVKKQKLKAEIVEVGCNGMCYQEPIVDVIQKKGRCWRGICSTGLMKRRYSSLVKK
jgi:hypothetical protein